MYTPKPTSYNGVDYKSKLEALHAFVLTYFGFKFKYEPVKHLAGKLTHIPDFYLYNIDAFAEVKPIAFNQLEYLKAYGVARKYRKPYIMLIDQPAPQYYQTIILAEQLADLPANVKMDEEAIINYFSVDLLRSYSARRCVYTENGSPSLAQLANVDLWYDALDQADKYFG